MGFSQCINRLSTQVGDCCEQVYDLIDRAASNKYVSRGALISIGVVATLAVQAVAEAWVKTEPNNSDSVEANCTCQIWVGGPFTVNTQFVFHQVYGVAIHVANATQTYFCSAT